VIGPKKLNEFTYKDYEPSYTYLTGKTVLRTRETVILSYLKRHACMIYAFHIYIYDILFLTYKKK
jgi:hypothetical protein